MVVRYGEGGIRTPDKAFRPYNGLANRRLQPLGHLSHNDLRDSITSLEAQLEPRFSTFSSTNRPKVTAPAPQNNDGRRPRAPCSSVVRSEEHTSELQSHSNISY